MQNLVHLGSSVWELLNHKKDEQQGTAKFSSNRSSKQIIHLLSVKLHVSILQAVKTAGKTLDFS